MFRPKFTFTAWALDLVQVGHYNYTQASWTDQFGLNVQIQIVFNK